MRLTKPQTRPAGPPAENKMGVLPEGKLLLGLGFFGGSVGALAGMQLFRHKTKHWYFWAVNIAGLLWQALVLLWLLKGVFL